LPDRGRARAATDSITVVSAGERLRVEARLAPDRVVLELHGELDLAAAPLLAEEIERAETGERKALVLDLGDLEFVDSAGLRVILAAHERALGSGREFAVTNGTLQVQRLFEIAGVGQHLQTIGAPDAELVSRGGEAGASRQA
jgi:anti-sigma B factor antagonist